MAVSDATFSTQSRAAADLAALEQLRVAALGKSGSVTALLKSLGAMDAETRAREGPKIHAPARGGDRRHRRRARTRSKRPSSTAGWRPSGSTCRCPRRKRRAAPSTRSAR